MRAQGKDIAELFGFAPDDNTSNAKSAFDQTYCPFTQTTCTKRNHDGTITYGVCSVTNGKDRQLGTEVVTCPKRLYMNGYGILQDVVADVWGGNIELIVGGNKDALRQKAATSRLVPAVAFGQGSGNEVTVNAGGKLSMDWVIQKYTMGVERLEPNGYVGVEVQSIDITGNYKEPWEVYASLKNGNVADLVPNSGHGLNWANVHKRLIPQLIRKGNIYSTSDACDGFYFLLPDVVFKKFEEVLGEGLSLQSGPSKDIVSVLTYKLSEDLEHGKIRQLEHVRTCHLSLDEIKAAFCRSDDDQVAKVLEGTLQNLL